MITTKIRFAVGEKSHSARPDFKHRMRLLVKWLLFPGLDIATRKRMELRRYLLPGDIATLDAGCGNGAFSYHAYRLGNEVLGINIDPDQVRRCNEFRDFLGLNASRCQFKLCNIYNILDLGQHFDQIICFETLEHLERDQEVLRLFAGVLRPGGTLHLCTPFLNRLPYFGEVISAVEDGGHLRLGYTFEILQEMLAKEGFAVVARDEVVDSLSQKIMDLGRWLSVVLLRKLPISLRDGAAGTLVMALLPATWLGQLWPGGQQLCLYIQARLE